MNQVTKTAEILNKNGIVIFPTETVYGIGCLLTATESISRLYEIKKRDPGKPTLALVKSVDQAQEWVEFDSRAKALADAFWPGPLTICLQVRKNVAETILGTDRTLAVRVSSHPFIQELLPKLSAPLLAPSANLQGKPPASRYSEIDKGLRVLVDYVVEIEPEAKPASTIVSLAKQKYNLIREGSISQFEIEKILNSKE